MILLTLSKSFSVLLGFVTNYWDRYPTINARDSVVDTDTGQRDGNCGLGIHLRGDLGCNCHPRREITNPTEAAR